MAGPLYKLPGLGAFYAAQDRNAALGAQETGQAMQVMQLGEVMRQGQRRSQLEQMAAAAAGDPNKLIKFL
jgi:hypothetical protein